MLLHVMYINQINAALHTKLEFLQLFPLVVHHSLLLVKLVTLPTESLVLLHFQSSFLLFGYIILP